MKLTRQLNLSDLNTAYEPLTGVERVERIFNDFDPERILVTSSFGATSAILLNMVSRVAPDHPVYFINTGYLFEETLKYKETIKDQLDLNVIDTSGPHNHHRFTQQNQSWKYNSDLCCFINKVSPTEKLRNGKDVWLSGLMRYQNANREKLRIFEPRHDVLKFHPIIDMTEEEVQAYATIYELPFNPLIYQGYGSIGCTHCTAKGEGREGRWLNTGKTECGLHA
ncbi:MAG: phosphoadenylyl-sulfate reductase [Cyclobacteriaceae bacterium]